jgi:hypothetical protein
MGSRRLSHGVVGDAGELGAVLGAGKHFEGREVQREDLDVVLAELVDLLEPCFDVVQHGDLGDALHHVSALLGHTHHLVEVCLRQDVVIDIDLHGALLR